VRASLSRHLSATHGHGATSRDLLLEGCTRPALGSRVATPPDASGGWCRHLCQESLSWLRELDAQPGPLEEWLQRQRNVRRLGFYFAALLEFWVRRCPALGSTAADVLVQQQIHAGVDGEVAGQLKLAFARRSVEKEVEVVHWESHVKFFAWRGDGANS